MVRFSKIFVIIFICSFFLCCRSGVYTYYCKENDLLFQMIEKDTFDVLVIGNKDSIFLPCSNGQYLGLQFYMPADSDVVYFELTPSYPIVYRYVESKNKINFIQSDITKEVVYDNSCKIFKYVDTRFLDPASENEMYTKHNKEICVDSNYWKFYGGCDQGKYVFGVMRGNKFISTLEPLEFHDK